MSDLIEEITGIPATPLTERQRIVNAAEQHPHLVAGRLFDRIEALEKRITALEALQSKENK